MAAESANVQIDQLSINIRKAVEILGINRVVKEVGLESLVNSLDKEQLKELKNY